MKPFTDSRRIFWLAGISVLVLGFIAAAVLLPATSPDPLESAPDIHVPKMQNVPDEGEKLKLDVEKENVEKEPSK